VKRIKTSGDSLHRFHSSTSLSHDDNTKLDQGPSAYNRIEKSTACCQSVDKDCQKILDVERVHGFINTTESGFDAGYDHD